MSLCRAPHLKEGSLERIGADLQAGVSSSPISVVIEGEENAARSDARVCFSAAGEGKIRLEVDDTLTNKKLVRVIDLGALPPDGHDLAVALAADELLRASWAELELEEVEKGRQATSRSRAAEPDPGVAALVPTEADRHWGVFLGPSLRIAPGKSEFFGGQLGVQLRSNRLRLAAYGHFLALAPRAHENDSEVTGRAWGGGASVSIDLLPLSRWSWGPLLGGQFAALRFEGRPGAGYKGGHLSGPWMTARTGLFSSLDVGASSWELQAGVDLSLLSLVAEADGQTVASTRGWGGWCVLSGGGRF